MPERCDTTQIYYILQSAVQGSSVYRPPIDACSIHCRFTTDSRAVTQQSVTRMRDTSHSVKSHEQCVFESEACKLGFLHSLGFVTVLHHDFPATVEFLLY